MNEFEKPNKGDLSHPNARPIIARWLLPEDLAKFDDPQTSVEKRIQILHEAMRVKYFNET